MEFNELNAKHGVTVLATLNRHHLVSVGLFESYAAADEYLDDARKCASCEIPKEPNGEEAQVIFPQPYNGPGWREIQEATEREGRIHIHIRVLPVHSRPKTAGFACGSDLLA
jgi:hypothetical protein